VLGRKSHGYRIRELGAYPANEYGFGPQRS
jgi:hypothetical protein